MKKKIIASAIAAILLFTALGGTAALASENTAVDAQKAEELALADAGISAETAESLKTKAERENGENVYDVSFYADGIEYDYLIRESDGEILEWEIDGRNLNAAAAEESLPESLEEEAGENTLIGLEQAKSIALEDAGVTAEDIIFSALKYEKENRRTVYEVEFYQGNVEFEYTIDAYSGEIVKSERERD